MFDIFAESCSKDKKCFNYSQDLGKKRKLSIETKLTLHWSAQKRHRSLQAKKHFNVWKL